MSDVRLDPQQVPARAELLLAAELGEDAPARPIYARPEPDGNGEPAARIKVGVMLTRRLSMADATETPSGAAYGNPLRGRPGRAPCVPIGSALLARRTAGSRCRGSGLRRLATWPSGSPTSRSSARPDEVPFAGRAAPEHRAPAEPRVSGRSTNAADGRRPGDPRTARAPRRRRAGRRGAAIVPFHNHPYRVTPRRASTTSP